MPRMRTCMSARRNSTAWRATTQRRRPIRHVRGARDHERVFRIRRRPIEPSDTETSDNIFVSDDGCVEETERLFDVSGRHDARVARSACVSSPSVLYDASVAHAVETRCVASDEIFELSDDDKSSVQHVGRRLGRDAIGEVGRGRRHARHLALALGDGAMPPSVDDELASVATVTVRSRRSREDVETDVED